MKILKLLCSADSSQILYNILGILGFALSALIWICTFLNNRTRLTVKVKDYRKYFEKVIQLYLYIQNDSDNAIVISGLSLLHNKQQYPCELLPKKIRGKGDDLIKTPLFPINLSPCQGVLLPFEFLDCQDIELSPDKTIALEIHTNRKKIEKSLTLDQPGYLLHFH